MISAVSLGGLAYALSATPTTTQVALASESPSARPTPLAVAPSDAPGTHTVRRGETLLSIASSFGVSEEQLRWWNLDRFPSLRANPREVFVGWVLVVDGPAMPTPSPRPTRVPAPVPPATSNGLATLPILLVDVWGASEEYFSISGRNPQELLGSARANVPSRCLEYTGQAVACAGTSVSYYEPTYLFDPYTGSCVMTGVTLDVAYVATLPQWTAPSPVPEELLVWWQAVLEHIRWHEEQHVRIFVDYDSRLPGLLAGQPCESAQQIVDAWRQEVIAAQEAFHVLDANFQWPSYSGPWSW